MKICQISLSKVFQNYFWIITQEVHNSANTLISAISCKCGFFFCFFMRFFCVNLILHDFFGLDLGDYCSKMDES